MNVLVIGKGGREHALAWKIKQSPSIKKVFVAPGNAGSAEIATNVSIGVNEIERLKAFALENAVDLTVVGPENALAAGIVNEFRKKRLNIFGPTKEAVQLESSKVFARKLMQKEGIPSPRFKVFSDASDAIEFAKQSEKPLVVKADGLAAGKGVIVSNSLEETIAGIKLIIEKKAFGESGSTILLEEKLEGIEASFFVVSDGKNFVPFLSAQDHKRIGENDAGLNTGGMGSFAPSPLITSELKEKILEQIVQPTIRGMQRIGEPFEGVLYCGLMIQNDQPKVVEFNCRFGDPETQAMLLLLESDLLELCQATTEKSLQDVEIRWKNGFANCVVLASKGYPHKPETGFAIQGLNASKKIEGTVLFHAGTSQKGNQVVSSGGRVLNCVGTALTLKEAIQKSYDLAKQISFKGVYYRKDIGKKGLLLS